MVVLTCFVICERVYVWVCNVWVCICVGVSMCGFYGVWVCMHGLCNVWMYVRVGVSTIVWVFS